MNIFLFFHLFGLFGCISTSQQEEPLKKQVEADSEQLILGRWETEHPHDICVRFSEEDRMEISFQRSRHPKHRVYGTRKQLKKENNHYTFRFTPSEIWQERYVRPCRKQIYDSKDLDKTSLLNVSMAIEKPLDIFVQHLPPEDKLKICLKKTMNPKSCFHMTRVQ